MTSWCIGWLALVLSYSGGNWVGDWFGHWQRAVFSLERLSPFLLFNGLDPVTSRPPLANIVVGAFMFITKDDFTHYQLGLTVVGSLAFLPAALLARRFGSVHSIRVLALFLMVSPVFVQNAPFAWTKLPATLFTLAGLRSNSASKGFCSNIGRVRPRLSWMPAKPIRRRQWSEREASVSLYVSRRPFRRPTRNDSPPPRRPGRAGAQSGGPTSQKFSLMSRPNPHQHIARSSGFQRQARINPGRDQPAAGPCRRA